MIQYVVPTIISHILSDIQLGYLYASIRKKCKRMENREVGKVFVLQFSFRVWVFYLSSAYRLVDISTITDEPTVTM